MDRLTQLRNRLAEIRSEAQAIVDAADENAGRLSAEQSAAFDALMDERKAVEADIARLEQLDAMDASAGRRSQPATPATPSPAPAPTSDVDVRDRGQDDPMRGFRSAAHFARDVQAACLPGGRVSDTLRASSAIDIQAQPTNFHRETGSSDGYMVPPAIRDTVWSLVFADEGILSRVAPEPTESNIVQLTRDESTPWSATGIQANWASEGTQFTPSRLLTEASNVQLHKLYAFVLSTDELLEDAARLESRLTRGAAEAIRYKADDAIVQGDGVGKPLGWFNAGCLVEVAKESGQAADTIVAANVLKMFARMLSMGAEGAFWLMHKSTVPQLGVLTIGDQPVWTPPSTGLTGAPGGMLLGMPILFSEHAQVIGDKGDIHLVAPRGYYATVKAGGLKFAASMHLYFDYDVDAFRWTFRLGGQPYLSAAISPDNGSDTLSHFVTLAERA